MITRIHKTGDYQTEDYATGLYGVTSIEKFNIAGLHANYPRLCVTFQDGKTVELDQHGITIYEAP